MLFGGRGPRWHSCRNIPLVLEVRVGGRKIVLIFPALNTSLSPPWHSVCKKTGTQSFCWLGLVIWTELVFCRILLSLVMTYNEQFSMKQFFSSQRLSEVKDLGDESPEKLGISAKYLLDTCLCNCR